MLILLERPEAPVCVAQLGDGEDLAQVLVRLGSPARYLVNPAMPAGWHNRMNALQVDWDTGAVTINSTPPQVVSRYQARAALHLAGLLTAVEALMADPATDMLARLAWTDAQEFRRTSPTLLAMASALSLTDAQLDQLFITAAGIDA